MKANHVTIKLTSEQQKQFKDATGHNLSELNIDLTKTCDLSEKELENVSGGLKIKLQEVFLSSVSTGGSSEPD